ncbi:hypothetical protein ACSBR1_002453 [Camellia fascicularis]
MELLMIVYNSILWKKIEIMLCMKVVQDIWDPFNSFFTSSLSNFPASAREASQFTTMRIDWKETPEAHIFKADLPGIKNEEISGERSKEQEEKNEKWHSVEQSSGKFLRRFRLPGNAKMDEVKASTENGVLMVTAQKGREEG